MGKPNLFFKKARDPGSIFEFLDKEFGMNFLSKEVCLQFQKIRFVRWPSLIKITKFKLQNIGAQFS